MYKYIILLIFCTFPLAAQQAPQNGTIPVVQMTYDDAGNRVQRSTTYTIYTPNKKGEEYWEEVKVYPNPVKDLLQVGLPEDLLNAQLRLIDLQGRPLYDEKATGNLHSINMGSFSLGTYILLIEYEGKREEWKIIKGE